MGALQVCDTQSELLLAAAAGQAEAASGHWQEWRLFTFPERPEHPRTLLLQRWPHGPSLHLKPAHRQDVEATGYPRPSQKESAKKSAVKAGESARGTAFDAEREISAGSGRGTRFIWRKVGTGTRFWRHVSTPPYEQLERLREFCERVAVAPCRPEHSPNDLFTTVMHLQV